MTRNEYEQRKKRLEEELRAGAELLQAAHRQQLRALELVWMTTAEGDEVVSRPVAEARPAPAVAPQPAPAAEPVTEEGRRRLEPGELMDDVVEALEDLPEVFDHHLVRKALGYSPERTSLYRVLRKLVQEGNLALVIPGTGKVPAQYRKVFGGDS